MMDALKRMGAFLLAVSLAGAALLWVVFVVEEMRDLGAVVALVAGTAVFGWLAQGPVGKGLTRILTGNPSPPPLAVSEEYLDLHDQLRSELQRLHDVEDRLDFAERLLARQSEGSGRGER
jgi:hypothetical protein